jgi:hypothetical protein
MSTRTPIVAQYAEGITLRFVYAVTLRDSKDFFDKNRRLIDFILNAFESWSDALTDENLTNDYGSMVMHIVRYLDQHGHTPNRNQLVDYLLSTDHERGKWGYQSDRNLENANILREYEPDDTDATEVEVVLPDLLKVARMTRFQGMMSEAWKRVCGHVKVFDRRLKEERRATYDDAVTVLSNYLRFDLQPEGSKRVSVPEMPTEALYGFLGQKAVDSGMPLGLIYPALLGVYAGNPIRVTNGAVHPCLYVALVGDVETGKSQAIERGELILGMKDFIQSGGHACHRSASSDRGLYKLFGDDPKDKSSPKKSGGTFVMCLTELRYMFTKLEMKNNSLPPVLCALWDSGRDSGTADKFSSVGCSVNLSIVGGLKCKDPEEFGDVFGSSTMHGLYSRFVFGCSSEKWEYTPSDEIGIARTPAEIEIPSSAWESLKAWRKAKPGRGRAAENALRIAVILEAAEQGQDQFSECAEADIFAALDDTNPTPVRIQDYSCKPMHAILSDKALQAALYFAEWQEVVKDAYTPSEAIDDDARCTEAILKTLDELGSYKWNTVCKNKHWCQKFGAARVTRCRNRLNASGQINYNKDTGWVEPC